jgi:hypothetical protein
VRSSVACGRLVGEELVQWCLTLAATAISCVREGEEPVQSSSTLPQWRRAPGAAARVHRPKREVEGKADVWGLRVSELKEREAVGVNR